MAKKSGVFIVIVLISIIFSSIYGFFHNQISYAISTEYFTKFKFNQFWSAKYLLDFPRMGAGLIGMASTWWFGLIIGLIIGSIGFSQPTTKIMWITSFGAIIRILVITIAFGIFGILVGNLILANLNSNWQLPIGLLDRKSFLTAGTMHNFSYLGGLIGLIYGIRYQLKIKKASIH